MKLCNTKYFEYLKVWREALYTSLTVNLYFPFCRAVYSGQKQMLSPQSLANCQPGTLGFQVRRFLRKNKIEFMPGYEAHDIKHVLLGYRANFVHELRMQFFELGNGNRSLPMWTVILFGIMMAPDAWPYFFKDYKRGKRAAVISNADLISNLDQPLRLIREKYKLSPC